MGRGHSSTSVKMSHLSGNSTWPLIKFVFACMHVWMDVCVRGEGGRAECEGVCGGGRVVGMGMLFVEALVDRVAIIIGTLR